MDRVWDEDCGCLKRECTCLVVQKASTCVVHQIHKLLIEITRMLFRIKRLQQEMDLKDVVKEKTSMMTEQFQPIPATKRNRVHEMGILRKSSTCFSHSACNLPNLSQQPSKQHHRLNTHHTINSTPPTKHSSPTIKSTPAQLGDGITQKHKQHKDGNRFDKHMQHVQSELRNPFYRPGNKLGQKMEIQTHPPYKARERQERHPSSSWMTQINCYHKSKQKERSIVAASVQ